MMPPGLSIDDVAKRLVGLRKLARLERKELGRVRASTMREINSCLATAEAVCVVDDAREQSGKRTTSAPTVK